MLLSSIPQKVRIVEVAPRDGLQNVSTVLPTDQKIALVEDLAAVLHVSGRYKHCLVTDTIAGKFCRKVRSF
mgnify:CR=1 FL=1